MDQQNIPNVVALQLSRYLLLYPFGGDDAGMKLVVAGSVSIAASTLVGQHLGARDPDGAARSGRCALAGISAWLDFSVE